MNKCTNILLLLTHFVLISCSELDEYINMKPLFIEKSIPANGNVSINNLQAVSIIFSREMNKVTAENAFSLMADKSQVHGKFLWESGSNLKFYPFEGFKENMLYEYSISEKAEDIYGNSLSKNLSINFNTGRDNFHPVILSSSIFSGEIVTDMSTPVIFSLSKPVTAESIYSSFSIYPAVMGFFTFREDNKIIIFSPASGYDNGTDYKVSFSTELKDITGNRMQNEYELLFKTIKFPVSEITGLFTMNGSPLLDSSIINLNTGIEKNEKLVLNLTLPAEDVIRNKPVKITPSEEYTADWNNEYTECILTFSNNLKFNEIYTLEFRSQKYIIKINGTDSIPPSVRKVVFCNSSADPEYITLQLNNTIIPLTSESAFFDFYFSNASSGAIKTASFFETFSITTGISDLKIKAVKIYNQAFEPLPQPDPLPPASDEKIIRVMCSIIEADTSSIIKIIIKKTIEDTLSNIMGEDFILMVNSL